MKYFTYASTTTEHMSIISFVILAHIELSIFDFVVISQPE